MTNDYFGVKGSKILIVDDKPENLELLSQILEAEGYEVAFAMDGEKAIQVACLFSPDLILLDVMMPGIDGFETCKRIKALHDLKEIPVIFVTGKANINDVVEGFNLGAVDYVTKPIRHEEIVARVGTHIQLQSLISLRDDLIDKFRKQNVELAMLAKLKDEQLEKSEKFSHLGEMVGELTHEIATPLGIINTAVTNLMEHKKKLEVKLEEQKMTKSSLDDFLDLSGESYSMVLSNLRHVIHLVDSFRQIVVGEFNQSKTNFDVSVYLEDIKNILTPKMKRTPHELIINCEKNIFMFAESGALSQVLLNIINNALIHAFKKEDQGTITITVTKTEGDISFEIVDNGCGVNEEKQSKMFDKYFTTRQDDGGSGLGLYIVKKLVEESLSGRIELNSIEGVGSCFTMTMPNGIDTSSVAKNTKE